MNLKFSEYRPSFPLSQFVQTYWTGDFNLYSENGFLQHVVPNGCVELVIHLTHDHCELIKENSWDKSPEFTLIGIQTKPYDVKFNQLVQVFGIRFNPEGIYSLFGVPPSIFTSTFENGNDVLGKPFNDYCARLRETNDISEKIKLTENFLLKKLSERNFRSDYVDLSLEIIRKNQGTISLNELIEQVPISIRQLQRQFKKRFGITIKEYMRLSRYNAIQKYMQSQQVNLTELTYESGFSDQSHFIKEFKLLTGIRPSGFLRDKEHFIANPAILS